MKILSLQKLKTKAKITEHILWEWTPQMVTELQIKDKTLTMEEILQFKKQSEERQGYFFYIDVWEETPTLLLKQQGKTVSEVIGKIEEIPEKMLLEAIEDTEGAIDANGEYPINEAIKSWLKQKLAIA